jgi:hypothetical protein
MGQFQKDQGAVKLHTLLDLRGNIPTFILHFRRQAPRGQTSTFFLSSREHSIVMDRGYLDFERFILSHTAGIFVIPPSRI